MSLFENLKEFVSSSGRCPCKQVLPMISEKSLSFLLLVNLSTAHCMLSLFPDGRELPSTALCLHCLSESTPPSHPFFFYYWFAAEKFQPLPGCCVLLQQMNTTAQKVILPGASLRCVHSLLSCVIEFFSKEWFVLTFAVVTFQSHLHPLHLGSSCLWHCLEVDLGKFIGDLPITSVQVSVLPQLCRPLMCVLPLTITYLDTRLFSLAIPSLSPP